MHAIWILLMDDDFMAAYVHGVVIECPDRTPHRFFP